jgi:hypothetical protein
MVGAKGTKGKQPKASGSRQLDAVVINTRKLSRLNDIPSSKKVRTAGTENLFCRLSVQLAAIGKTCDKIVDSMDA